MTVYDAANFRKRAAIELRLAAQDGSPASAEVHRELAGRYQQLANRIVSINRRSSSQRTQSAATIIELAKLIKRYLQLAFASDTAPKPAATLVFSYDLADVSYSTIVSRAEHAVRAAVRSYNQIS